MMQTIRWGILSPGTIARGFAQGIRQTDGSVLRAVASRDYGKSLAFKDEFDAEIAYGSYEELVNDPAVDICYISTINPFHYELAKLCLEHNKPVVVEKPFTINAKQAEALIKLAHEKNLFLMEAMWMRFNPAIHQVKQWIEEGRIGEARLLQANFGYDGGPDKTARHLNRELGGGALLDIGIYNLSLCGMIFGHAFKDIKSTVELDEEMGVDRSFATLINYGHQTAMLTASVVCSYKDEARVLGTTGVIEIPEPFYNPSRVVLRSHDGAEEVFTRDPSVNGFNYEVAEAASCLREGLKESPWQTHEETLVWMRVMDELRRDWGVRYPEDDSWT